MRRPAIALAILAAAIAVRTAPAGATVVVGQDLADISRQADAVFVGKVATIESRWRDEAAKSIETVVTFTVVETIYGPRTDAVTLRFGGGEVGGLRQVIAGMPQFRVGEEVLLFVTDEPSISPIVGFHQGCFRVEEYGGERVVLDAEGAPITGTTSRSLSVGRRQDGPAAAMPLDRFLDTVRRHLAERGESDR